MQIGPYKNKRTKAYAALFCRGWYIRELNERIKADNCQWTSTRSYSLQQIQPGALVEFLLPVLAVLMI